MRVENENRFHLRSESAEKPLNRVPMNERFRISRLEGPPEDCNRLLDLGFTPGEEVAITHSAPFGDPLVVHVRGALLALRKREAGWIWVQ